MSTNDEFIAAQAEEICKIHFRSETSAVDTASTWSLLAEFASDLQLDEDETIITLYLTYPERQFSEVLDAYKFFNDNNLQVYCVKRSCDSPLFMFIRKRSR